MYKILVGAIVASTALVAAETSSPAVTNRVQLQPLESKFQNTLSNAVFDGRWCLIEKGKLAEEYNDRYTIQGATKVGGESWLIYTRIQYGGKDVSVPVPAQVKFAGDTPVITLDKIAIPGLGTYSARVLIFDNTYAGVWSANDHGGMLHGIIERAVEPKR